MPGKTPDRLVALRVLAYPETIRYLRAWTDVDGQRRERQVDAVAELGRPSMGEIMARIRRHAPLRTITPEQLGGGDMVLDSPAGMLPCHWYRQHRVLMINNNGSLPRGHLEEMVYRAGSHWLWHNRSDVLLFRRFFAEAFHSRALYQPWFVDPPRPDSAEPLQLPGGPLPEGPLLAYCGRLHPEKRIDLLIHLLKMVRRQSDANLLLTGTFPATKNGIAYRRQIHTLVATLGLVKQVHWLGYIRRAQLASVLARADLLVNLTVNHDETFGMVQAEALSFGTPVLAAGWGGLKEVVTDECGFIADTLVTDHGTFVDLHSAAAFVVKFLGDPLLQRRMSAAAKKRAARFGWPAFLTGLKGQLSRATDDTVPQLDPDSPMRAVLEQVLSPAFHQRARTFLNPRLLEQSAKQIHVIRNGKVLGKHEWLRFALIDPLRHNQFIRENYLFLYEHYGTLTPRTAAARLTPSARLHPLRVALEWTDDTTVTIDEPVFGRQQFSLGPTCAYVFMTCVNNPAIILAALAGRCALSTSRCSEAVRKLLGYGLVLPVLD